MRIEDALLRAQAAAAPEVGRSQLATYIPSLASVDRRPPRPIVVLVSAGW